MEVLGIFLPLIVVLVVHTLLSTVSRTLANVVVLVMGGGADRLESQRTSPGWNRRGLNQAKAWSA